jgi:LysR family transcriptional regulator, low CO2-responsive transcriptional regulator
LRPFSDARIEMDEFVVCLRDRRRLGVVRAFVEVAKELAAQEGAATHA